MTTCRHNVEALRSLGYTSQESEFLYLVAIHSGYFTHRQFLSFTHTKPGNVSYRFISKLLRQKLAGFHPYRAGRRVYHLFSRKVYRAIERDYLSTRRRHQLDYIKSRLVALDFVLDHPHHHYLETDAEKVSFFEKQMGVRLEFLPARLYRSAKSLEATPRYFVDRFPLFVNALLSPPVVTFTYVDPGSVTLQPFRTHLATYSELLRRLERFDLFYLGPSSRLFSAAESEFYRFLSGRSVGMSHADLIRYYQVRLAWESNHRVPSSDVLFLKEAKARYIDKKFDSLYEKWRCGDLEESAVGRDLEEFLVAPVGVFRTHIFASSLTVFSKAMEMPTESCSGVVAARFLDREHGTSSEKTDEPAMG